MKNYRLNIHSFRVLAVTFIILLTIGCTQSKETVVEDDSTQVVKEDSGTIRIAVLPTSDCEPFLVADSSGVFEEMGLKVRLVPFTAQMDVDTALVGGSVDLAFSDRKRIEWLKTSKKIQLTEVCPTNLHWTLVSNRKARLNRPDQFAEKMVAMTRYSATDWLCDSIFKGVELKSTYFKVQINDINIRLNMLLNNQMDAAWLPEPQATVALKAGHKKVAEDKASLGTLVARTQFIKKTDKQTVEKLRNIYAGKK